MGDPQSKRVRMRFFPEEEQALEQALKLTTLTSQSNVLRAALILFEEIWSHECSGTSVSFMHGQEPIQRALETLTNTETSDSRPKTSISLEIRVTPNDASRIQRLLEAEAADTVSAIVRTAIRLYAIAVKRTKKGETLQAFPPHLPPVNLTILGMGTPVKKSPESDTRHHPLGRGMLSQRIPTLWDLLPKSLADQIRTLATQECCDPESLLVDMIRTETLARLHELNLHPEKPSMSEPGHTEDLLPVTDYSHEDALLLVGFSGTIDHMTSNIDSMLQQIEGKSPGQQQTTFTDMLFGMDEATLQPPPTDPVDPSDPRSVIRQFAARINRLNEQIEKLLLLHHRERKPRKTARTEAKTPTESSQALIPLGADGEWALVVATDENGAPQQRVVGSQTIIPLSEAELSGNDQ